MQAVGQCHALVNQASRPCAGRGEQACRLISCTEARGHNTIQHWGICKQRGDCKHEGNLTTIAVLRRRACTSRRGNMTQRHSSTLHALDLSLRQNRGCGWLTAWLEKAPAWEGWRVVSKRHQKWDKKQMHNQHEEKITQSGSQLRESGNWANLWCYGACKQSEWNRRALDEVMSKHKGPRATDWQPQALIPSISPRRKYR